MKPSFLRVLISELILVSFLSTTLVPIHIWADEVTLTPDVVTPVEDPLPPVVSDEPTVETPSITENSGSVTIPLDTPSASSTGELTSPSDTGSTTSTGGLGETILLSPSETGSTQSGTLDPSVSIFDIPVIIPPSSETGSVSILEEKTLPEKSKPENEVLVQFNDSNIHVDSYIGQYQIDQIESTQNIAMTDTIPEQNIAIMTVQEENPANVSSSGIIDADVIDAKITELKKDPRVKYVQKNFIYKITSTSIQKPIEVSSFSGRSLPNDTGNFQNLWALDNHGQAVGDWDIVSGEVDADIDYPEAMAYASGKLNTKVIVAILDSGIESNHVDLQGNLWDGTNCKSDTGSVLGGCKSGYDFVDEDTNPVDTDHVEHGSHVAGTIGAVTNNGTGTVGVSPNVAIMPIRVCGEWGCSTDAIIRGINFAKNNGAKVINASFGYLDAPHTQKDFDTLTYEAIRDFPGLFVAAAGNDGINTDSIKHFPSGFGSNTLVSGEAIIDRELVYTGTVTIPALQNVISVGASDQKDTLAYFSNYGTSSVDIAAPGVNIYSTVMLSGTGIKDSVSGENGWIKQANVSGEFWNTRTIGTISGEYVDLTGALWADNITPYAPDTSAYIQKDFHNITPGIYDVRMEAWCDSSKYSGGYLDVLLSSTGGVFEGARTVDRSDLYFDTTTMSSTWIDGHRGYYGDILIQSNIYLDQNAGMRIKWRSEGPNTNLSAGCIVKDVILAPQTSGYEFMDGTSMATPHVTGAAALAWSYKPTATISEIKNAILNSSDLKLSFIEKISAGGRLNISNMLQYLDVPRIFSQRVTVSGESSALVNVETTQNILNTLFTYSTNSGTLMHPNTVATMILKNATVAAPINNTISSTSNQEVGRFAITADGDTVRVTKISATASGTYDLLSNVVSPSSIELWNADTNTKISANTSITGDIVSFNNITNDIQINGTQNFKIIFTSVNSLDTNYGKSLQFTVSPGSINASSINNNITVEKIGIATMKAYTIGVVHPTVLLTASPLTQNSKIATLRVTNVDSNTGITLSGLVLTFQSRSTAQGNFVFNGNLCLRDLGSSASCGGVGTTTSQAVTQTGGTFTINIAGSSLANASNTLVKNGGYVDYEVYLDNAPLWMNGDSVSVDIESLSYNPGNKIEKSYTRDSETSIVSGKNTTLKAPIGTIIGNNLTQNSKIATLRVTNVDSNTGITLSGLVLTFQSRSTAQGNFSFAGNLCLRDLGSSASCGGVGTTTAQSVTQTGGTFTINIAGSTLSNATNTLTKNGGYVDYEVYLDNAPLWMNGDSVSVDITGINYRGNNVNLSRNIFGKSLDGITSSYQNISITHTTSTTTINLSQQSNTGYRGILTGLTPNTTYYYRILACSIGDCNSDNTSIYSFTTPSVVGSTISGPLTTSGSVYMSGSNTTGGVFSGSTSSGHIILIHPDTSVRVDIPTQNLIISASGSWDGILNAPRTVTGTTTISVSNTSIPVSVIYKVGSDTSSLSLSGQVATISIASALPNGTVVAVYRADSENSPYTQITSCTITNSLCTFTTDHFSVFALGSGNTGNNTGGNTQGNTSIGNTGPGGGGGGAPVFINSVGTTLQSLISISSSGILLPTLSIPTLNIFKRQETISWIEKNMENLGSTEVFNTLESQIQLQETRLGRLIAYDVTLNAIGSLIRKNTGSKKSVLSKVQKNLGTSRKIYIKALFGY